MNLKQEIAGWVHWFAGAVVSVVMTYLTVPAFQKTVNNAVASHPKIATLLTSATGIALAYLNSRKVTSSGANSAGPGPGIMAGTGKTGATSFSAAIRGARLVACTTLLAILSGIMVATPIAGAMLTTGCTASQVIAGIEDVTSKLPEIAPIAGGLLLLIAPEYLPLVSPGVQILETLGNDLQQDVAAYAKNPTAPLLAKINAAYQQGVSQLSVLGSLGIKDAGTMAHVTETATEIGLIFNDLASWVQGLPAATTAQLSAFFGWHIAGVDLVAIDGQTLPSPVQGKVKRSGFSARQIAQRWNKSCGTNEQAKIHVTRYHFLGFIPVPGTGHK